GFCTDIVWLDSQYAIELRLLFIITPEASVTKSDLVERVNVARVELKCSLEASCRFFPVSLTSQDETHRLEQPIIIRQSLASNFQFLQRAVVIDVAMIKIPRPRAMPF